MTNHFSLLKHSGQKNNEGESPFKNNVTLVKFVPLFQHSTMRLKLWHYN